MRLDRWSYFKLRKAFTILELATISAILLTLAALLLPSIVKVHRANQRAACAHEMKRVVHALQAIQNLHNRLPPVTERFPSTQESAPLGTLFFHCLPHLGEFDVYSKALDSQDPLVRGQALQCFRCPSDPSEQTVTYAPGNFNANYFVFGNVPGGHADLTDFQNGAANVILLAERYSICSLAVGDKVVTGNGCWARRSQQYGMYFASTAFFQVLPDPETECRYERPQSGHHGGMNIGMGDGSVRFVTPQLSMELWLQSIMPPEIAKASNYPSLR